MNMQKEVYMLMQCWDSFWPRRVPGPGVCAKAIQWSWGLHLVPWDALAGFGSALDGLGLVNGCKQCLSKRGPPWNLPNSLIVPSRSSLQKVHDDMQRLHLKICKTALKPCIDTWHTWRWEWLLFASIFGALFGLNLQR